MFRFYATPDHHHYPHQLSFGVYGLLSQNTLFLAKQPFKYINGTCIVGTFAMRGKATKKVMGKQSTTHYVVKYLSLRLKWKDVVYWEYTLEKAVRTLSKVGNKWKDRRK